MTKEGDSTSEHDLLRRQAKRLFQIGKIFLELTPQSAQETGSAEEAFRMWIDEDMKSPLINNPSNEFEKEINTKALVANAKAEEKLTTVRRYIAYFISRDEEDIHLACRTIRVDLGYKTPTIEFDTGSEEGDLEAAAEWVADNVSDLQNRTEKEKREDEWDAALSSTVLADFTNEVVVRLDSSGGDRLTFTQTDNISGFAYINPPINLEEQSLSSGEAQFLDELEFNLLRTLQEKAANGNCNDKIVKKIRELVNDYCGEEQ